MNLRTTIMGAALAACGHGGAVKPGGGGKPVAAPQTHVVVTAIAPRLDDGKLWLKYQATPKKVMTDESLLVRAACTKPGAAAPMRDTEAWPLESNVIDTAKDYDQPLSNIVGATACQFEFQLVANITTMSGEHVSTACWSGGKVSDGACAPPITETYAQGVQALCDASKNVRWDAKGSDRDVELVRIVEDRVWNQQAKDLFTKLEADPEAKRVAPLKAEAGKQGVADCALVTFWATPK